MERIGDHAADISEMTILMADSDYEKSAINMEVIKEMAKETTDMVIKSVDAFVNKDLELARWSSTVMMWWTIFLTVSGKNSSKKSMRM